MTDRHLCEGGPCQDARGPLTGGHMTQLSVLSTMQARAVAVMLSVGEAQVLVALWRASRAFSGARLRTPSIDPLAKRGRVFVETFAKVGLTQQVDDGVVDGGGLGEDSGDGERIRRNPCGISKSSPHRHHCIWAPGTEEPDTNGY